MLFRWLFIVDPWLQIGHYQPLIWIEYAKEHSGILGAVAGRHLLLQLTIPPEKGRAFIAIPLSIKAFHEMGDRFIFPAWESWNEESKPDDGLNAPQGYTARA
jgi:hypothetical protein